VQTFNQGDVNFSPSGDTKSTHPFSELGGRAVLLLGLITLLALGLRFFRLADQAFWIDEIYSVYTALSPWNQFYANSAHSNSLPTYFLILRAVLPESGDGLEWAARLPSALAGTLSVPVFAALVYCWRRNRRTALLAGLLLAVNPLHIWYSQEARAYALMLFFGLLAMLFMELALFSRRSEWLTLYLFSVFPAVALHRSAIIFPILCGGWHALSFFRQSDLSPKKYKHLLIHLPVVIGIVLLMFVKLNPPPDEYRRAASILQFGYTFMTFLGGYSFGPSLSEIQNHGPLAAVLQSWPQVFLLLAGLALIAVAARPDWRKLVFTKEFLLLAAGLGIVTAYSLISGFSFNIRYVLPSLFGFLAIVAFIVANLPHRPRFAALITVAVLGIAVWADAQWFFNSRYRKPDARELSKWLANNANEVKSFTVAPAYLYAPVWWYLTVFPADTHGQPPTNLVTTTFPPVPDVLIIQRRDQISQPDKLINSYREAAGGIQTNYSFTGFELYIREQTK
jgi:predicted membrane-bound mannosyltransferase